MGVIYFFSSISKVLSKISTSSASGLEIRKPVWAPFMQCKNYTFQYLFVDEIMFGPSYYQLKSDPTIQYFDGKVFGDFKHFCFNGVLLQKWNTIEVMQLPDFELVYVDCETGEYKELGTIKSFSWTTPVDEAGEVKLKWFNGTEGGEIRIKAADL